MSIWLAIALEAAAIVTLFGLLLLVNRRVTLLAAALALGNGDAEDAPEGGGEANGSDHFGADQS